MGGQDTLRGHSASAVVAVVVVSKFKLRFRWIQTSTTLLFISYNIKKTGRYIIFNWNHNRYIWVNELKIIHLCVYLLHFKALTKTELFKSFFSHALRAINQIVISIFICIRLIHKASFSVSAINDTQQKHIDVWKGYSG